MLFATLADQILKHIVDAKDSGKQHSMTLVLVLTYLHRHAAPLKTFLDATFQDMHVKAFIAPFDDKCIKVLVVDSARGMTASFVHVIRGERLAGRNDQYFGIQGDEHREYISYTRGKHLCHVWLQVQPFGVPGDNVNVDPASAPKGIAIARRRNQLIQQQNLPWYQVRGVNGDWSWYYALPQEMPESVWTAIGAGLQSCRIMSMDTHSILGKQFNDPISAIHGLVSDTALEDFVTAELATIRAHGILRHAIQPVTITDPDMQAQDAYNLDVALAVAMKIAPAVTVDLHKDSEYTQLCIPTLSGPGLLDLGVDISQTGELLLRAFVRVVHNLYWTLYSASEPPLQPFARTHKAETVEILGERWFSKSCNSDREAVGLLDPEIKGSKSVRLYCYLGGGGLSEGSTWHAQGVVVKAKSWHIAVAVCCAVHLLTAAVPGPVASLDARLCIIDEDVDDADDVGQDTTRDTKDRPPSGLEPFLEMYRTAIVLACPIGDPLAEHDRSIEGVRAVCDILRNREAQPQFGQ